MENRHFLQAEERDHRSAILEILRGNGTEEEKRAQLDEYHDNDIATVFAELTAKEKDGLPAMLGREILSAVLPYVENAGVFLSELDADEAADILEQMDADEALEALEDLDAMTRARVMEHIKEAAKEDIRLIDSYDDDEFGSKMSTNFITIRRDMSIKDAMRTLVAEAEENDNIHTLFVTDAAGIFYGAVDLKDLIVARSSVPLASLISTAFPYVHDKEKISESMERLRSYSESLIPVISGETGKLLGVLTSDDMIEMVDEERSDDYAKLAALTAEEDTREGLLRSMRKRIPWLVVLLFMGLAVSAVVGLFEAVVDALPLIVSFQSLILGMAGNVGTQSLAVTVRSLGTEKNLGFKKQVGIVLKETRVALFNGFAIGAVSFLLVCVYLWLFGEAGSIFAIQTAGCVGIAMLASMMISGFTGAAIPITLSRMGADPAVASGPLITTVNDLVAVVSYYGLAWGLLLGFGR